MSGHVKPLPREPRKDNDASLTLLYSSAAAGLSLRHLQNSASRALNPGPLTTMLHTMLLKTRSMSLTHTHVTARLLSMIRGLDHHHSDPFSLSQPINRFVRMCPRTAVKSLMTHLGSEPLDSDLAAPTPPLIASLPLLQNPVPARPLNPRLGLLPLPKE